MPGGLYGDLELAKSVGHTPLSPAVFLTSTILAYTSGNCINFIDTVSPSTKNSDSPPDALKSVHANAQITAFALWRRENVVAYAERENTVIKLVKWPSEATLGMGKLEAPKDVKITALAFSYDGQYLAALGSLPTFSITVWDWRSGALICEVENHMAVNVLSFCPLDPTCLCVSGEDGIRFLRIEMGHKKNVMKSITGKPIPMSHSTLFPAVTDQSPKPTTHTWTIDNQILCTTDTGNELVHYDPATGECEVFVAAGEDTEDSSFENGQMACAVVAREAIIIGGKDGFLRWYAFEAEKITKTIPVAAGTELIRLAFSPDYQHLLVESMDGRLFHYKVGAAECALTLESPGHPTHLTLLRMANLVVTASHSSLQFYSTEDPDRHALIGKDHLSGVPTCIASSSFAPLVAVGSSSGVVRLYDCRNGRSPRLIARHRVHHEAVEKISFDPSGRYLISCSKDGRICLFEAFDVFGLWGSLKIEGDICACAWSLEEDVGTALFLYILTVNPRQRTSFVHRFSVPLERKAKDTGELHLPPSVVYKIDDVLVDMVIVPSHLSAGRETFYVTSVDRKLKSYQAPAGSKVLSTAGVSVARLNDDGKLGQDVVHLGVPAYESQDHEKAQISLHLSSTSEWLITCSSDGTLTVRTLMEPDKIIRIYAHDPFQGGCASVACTRDCRVIVSLGRDGLIRFWEWKYSVAGRRAATETTGIVERLADAQKGAIGEIEENIQRAQTLTDVADTSSESLIATSRSATPTQNIPHPMQNVDIQNRLQTIRERLLKAIAKNDSLPSLERLDREEFVLDYEERDRLLGKADGKVREVRREIEEDNMKKKVIGARIKQECWDSMEIIGQSIKSFNPDPLTGRHTVVPNYPIRKQSLEEIERVNRVMFLRKVGMLVANATAKVTQKKGGVREMDLTEELDGSDTEADTQAKAPTPAPDVPPALLYTPFDLTTNDRRRTQMILLQDHIQNLKKNFNNKFAEFVKLKRDEMLKIEEKGERCKGIMDELGNVEGVEIFKPVLDREEEPGLVVEVKDEEIKCEKFITPEEQQRLLEKQRQDAERLRAAALDNARDRALTQMMNNRLEDRSAEEDTKALLTKPDFMTTKPASEWLDEEKKLAKEYEKKLATQKEEQEKTRKALETELKKLLASITEICDQFDSISLRQTLFELKLSTDNIIYQHELVLIKLYASILYASEDEAKEQAITSRLEACKGEKMHYSAEIPELKKDLERCREEYETALKKDKEVERAFRKEFGAPGMEGWWEACWRLFKRRDAAEDSRDGTTTDPSQQDLNPYKPYEPQHHPSRPTSHALTPAFSTLPPPTPCPLNPQTDTPEGLPADLFQNLIAIRNRKIQTEADLHTVSQTLHNLQTLITNLLEASDQIRLETEELTGEMNGFVDYRFGSTFDLEVLVGLKQGQVEVPQAPVVTDYSDAVLVHRSVVERLNEAIVALGQTKVAALREMKEYRRGIHALEWETKMLDFQAESLTLRTRDIQLLRVTKSMQEFIRGGDDKKHLHEIAALEKRAEHSIKAHHHKLSEMKAAIERLERKVREKKGENKRLDMKVDSLGQDVRDRKMIAGVVDEEKADEGGKISAQIRSKPKGRKNALGSIYARRRLIDLAKSQAQDIAILREEVERLRLRTYPAFPARRAEF